MPKFLPQVFITGVVLLLLLGAGYGISQAARAIPWDCSDWQAFAHDDRTTAILESLAENRGKTLYCGVDQSDTFAKTETWEAGRDRNERDDTVYFGERGSFRGFIAAQEGWLTDGESGITGISIDRIFEFPREEKKRRRKKPPKPNLVYDMEYPDSALEVPEITASDNMGGLINGYLYRDPAAVTPPFYIRGPRTIDNGYVRALGPVGSEDADEQTARDSAALAYVAPTDEQAAGWALNGFGDPSSRANLEVPGGATEECRALGYTRATRVNWWYRDNNDDGIPDLRTSTVSGTAPYQYRRFRIILYTARCVGRQ